MNTLFQHFIREEEGQTLVEYGLLISLIALVLITTLSLLGKRLQKGFETTQSHIITTT
ncbi:MAG: Flp family type IVb pilin [Abitibacteriaceae bacterium]|nr:Flp family type IVb pilin [Abditibacteriaceae bacterium]MBV9864773.1 Flp family type IVb pilin [Abditibacteriaceae bacterium]